MRGVYYSACSLCYKTIAQFQQKCLLMRDCLLFRRLLLPESTVPGRKKCLILRVQEETSSQNTGNKNKCAFG